MRFPIKDWQVLACMCGGAMLHSTAVVMKEIMRNLPRLAGLCTQHLRVRRTVPRMMLPTMAGAPLAGWKQTQAP